MTPEEDKIRRAVAEAMGWQFNGPIPEDAPDYEERKTAAVGCWYRPGNSKWQLETLPDFCKSRDAIASALATLTEREQDEFSVELDRILNPEREVSMSIYVVATAPPLAICRAFLRAKGTYA